jgi:hypothetical protein
MSVNYNPRIVTDGLVMYLDASNKRSYSSGNNWLDLTGRFTAVKGGSQSPTYPQHNCEFFTFNGGVIANNYSRFDVANIPSFSQLSAFAWYRTTDTTNSKTIIRMDNSDFELSVNQSTSLFIAAGTNFNDVLTNPTQSNATDGNWHNIGLTFNGQVLIGYFDGIQVGTTTRGSATTTAAGTLRIGTRDDAYAQHFFGDIATITIYNRVLSRDEILRNFYAIRSRIYDCSGSGGTGGGFE